MRQINRTGKAMTGKVDKRTTPKSLRVMGFVPTRPNPQYVKLCCPRCRSRNLVLTEVWQHAIQWYVTDGWIEKDGGSLDEGAPTGIEARCESCNHAWTARGATQVWDVIEDA